MKKLLLIIMIFFGSVSASFAQLKDIGPILQSGISDANVLAKAYLNPLGRGFGAVLNSGWISTAKNHKSLGFDVSVRVGLAIVPTVDKTFNTTNLSFQRLQYDNSITNNPTMSPTVMGPNQSGTTFIIQQTVNGTTYNLGNFTMPGGAGIGIVPAPMVQVGVGLIHDTDLIIRFLPKTSVGKFGSFNLFGFGIKEGINQYLPGGKLLPVDLAVQIGYTQFQANANLNVQPVLDSHTTDTYPASTWDGQNVQTTTNAWNANIIVGKTIPFVSVFAGLGIEGSQMSISSPGSYPITVPDPLITDPNHKTIDKIDKPLDIKINGSNSVRALIGLRLNLAFFNITGTYTLAKYSMANVGIGFSFR